MNERQINVRQLLKLSVCSKEKNGALFLPICDYKQLPIL